MIRLTYLLFQALFTTWLVGLADAPKFPDTQAGRIGQKMIEAINSGSEDKMRDFNRLYLATVTDGDLRLEEKAWQESQGVQVLRVRGSNPLTVTLASNRDRHVATLVLDVDEAAGKVRQWWMMRGVDPAAVTHDALPSRRVGAGDIAGIVDKAAKRLLDQGRFSGTVLVMKGDQVLLDRAYGIANREFGIPNTIHTRYNLASMGKMFTSVAIAQLVEAGKLTYDTTVAQVLPDYPNQEAAKKITIRHLLTHQAGLGNIYGHPKYDRSAHYLWQADYYPAYANDPLLFEPGKGHAYSNAGYVLLATIVEKLSGQRFDRYLAQHVFGPAGMTETGCYQIDDIIPSLANGYVHAEDDPFAEEPLKSNRSMVPMPFNGSGGEYGTALDMGRFGRALAKGKLVGPAMLRQMFSPQTSFLSSGRLSYAFGFEIGDATGKKYAGHSGGGVGLGINADLEFFLDGSYVVAVVGNVDPPETQNFARRIRDFLAFQG